jgi:plasmid stabilization system protein ParE
LASEDVLEIARYYEERSSGLGKEFRDELAAVIDLLRHVPYAAPAIRGNLRRKSLDRFPYSLIYAVEENELHIYAVMRHRRRPDVWMSRLKPGRAKP